MATEQKSRVLIAVTERGPVQRIWQAMLDSLHDTNDSDIVAVFVADDRWERAASLPFTREVLLISGRTCDFTPNRAREIVRETAGEIRSELETLAAESGRHVTFEILPAGDQPRVEQLISQTGCVVIAPSELAGSPIHVAFDRLECE